ncbi:Ubiquitin domain [Arabidopsis suecica]|uniref:Ubiquitin domain n=1 Tax=Arabidopsis suecica TaxID=45249 RepID=A0A8T2E5R8_ARASU|nr:Ubiquitin domain [Arabidopsis suecica]
MKFLVEILGGSSFEIEVERTDTLLVVKQKIEKSQRVPVSKQTLIVDGIFILREDLNLDQCQIFHDSQIQLEVSPDVNPIHNDDDQMPQTEQSTQAPWISVEEYFAGQDWPLTEEEIRKIYSYRPETTQDISKIQDAHQTEESPPSNSVKETVNIQDSSVKFASKNNNDQVPPTKQFPQSNLVKKITNGKKRVRQMLVYVSPYPGMNEVPTNILVQVKVTDEVKTLRGLMKLPQEGYIFTHNNQVLNEDQSYECNSVKPLDTIVIVPRRVIQETSKIQDSSVTVQVPQMEQSPASNSVKEITDPKKKIKVYVVAASSECKGLKRFIEVDVNSTDQVKILRTELVESGGVI